MTKSKIDLPEGDEKPKSIYQKVTESKIDLPEDDAIQKSIYQQLTKFKIDLEIQNRLSVKNQTRCVSENQITKLKSAAEFDTRFQKTKLESYLKSLIEITIEIGIEILLDSEN